MHRFLLPVFALLLAATADAQSGRYRDFVFSQATLQSDLAYGQAINRTTGLLEILRLDLYEPAGDTAAVRPAVVIVHGGSFIFGDKAGPEYAQLGDEFARRGYVAVSINYRLGFPPLQQVRIDASHDMKAAVRWLRANAASLRIDPSRIGCIGGSAGAFMSLNVAYANIGEGTSGNPGFPSDVQAVVDLWGALEFLSDMQAGDVPVQIIHGTNDLIVPYQNALDLKARADAVGVPAELLPIQNAGHSPWTDYFQNFDPEAVGFLYETLQLGELGGLDVRPGFASPGTIVVDAFGPAGSFYAIAAAPNLTQTLIPGIGVAAIGPAPAILVLSQGVLPTAPRIGVASLSLPVPAGLMGLTAHWQGVQLDGQGALFTNTVTTTF